MRTPAIATPIIILIAIPIIIRKRFFSGLSVSARPGDIVGVTGPVACGKSAFGRAFLCRKPYGGSIRFGGTELSDLSPREIAATVGYLGHDPELFADTVENNVLCGSSGDAMKPLAAVKPDEEVRAMKDGLQTVIGSGGVRLSGGQAQRKDAGAPAPRDDSGRSVLCARSKHGGRGVRRLAGIRAGQSRVFDLASRL